MQEYYPNGKVQSEAFYQNDQLHRTNGPAFQSWHDNGQKELNEYYQYNNLHREDGPAIQQWDKEGNLLNQEYYINDEQLSPNKFKAKCLQLKFRTLNKARATLKI